MSKERPILFSGEMVRAILDCRKTQTRRVIKPQPSHQVRYDGVGDDFNFCLKNSEDEIEIDDSGIHYWELLEAGLPSEEYIPFGRCPYGQPGDLLWVRETWAALHPNTDNTIKRVSPQPSVCVLAYKATEQGYINGKWRSSIYMPRWASRITLRVTDVRVERVQEISEADAKAEGCNGDRCDHAYRDEHGCTDCYGTGWLWTPQLEYMDLWNSINAAIGFGWEVNPWVWVVEFERAQP